MEVLNAKVSRLRKVVIENHPYSDDLIDNCDSGECDRVELFEIDE